MLILIEHSHPGRFANFWVIRVGGVARDMNSEPASLCIGAENDVLVEFLEIGGIADLWVPVRGEPPGT